MGWHKSAETRGCHHSDKIAVTTYQNIALFPIYISGTSRTPDTYYINCIKCELQLL